MPFPSMKKGRPAILQIRTAGPLKAIGLSVTEILLGEALGLLFAKGVEAEGDMAQLLRQCGGKGGGRPDLAQGSAADGEALRQAVKAVADSENREF